MADTNISERAMRQPLHLVFLLCCLGQLAAGQATADAKLSIDQRVFTASKVYSQLQLYFSSSKGSSDPSLDTSYKNYLRAVLATEDRRQFDLATMEFVAQLHNGHTFFWDAWLNKNDQQPPGFYAALLDGKWVVQTSLLDNLKSGDVIASIDKTPIDSFFQQQQRYIAASSTAAQRHNLFLYPYLFPEQFTLTLEDGRKVAINRSLAKEPETKTDGRWLKPGQTAYIRIPSFFYPILEDAAFNYVNQFRAAKVLVIDLRNNPGGLQPMRLLKALMDRPYRGWKDSTAMHIGVLHSFEGGPQAEDSKGGVPDYFKGYSDALAALSNAQLMLGGGTVSSSQPIFHGRLIILIDGGCISACEDLVEPFKDNGRATLVGEATQGSAGVPYTYDFHNGMSLKISVKREYFPDGSEFEGVGIKPDIEVHATIDDFRNGRDAVLEKALELAAKS
jgi:carboxyl-terminal processing protease